MADYREFPGLFGHFVWPQWEWVRIGDTKTYKEFFFQHYAEGRCARGYMNQRGNIELAAFCNLLSAFERHRLG
jgi:hypothetical protein